MPILSAARQTPYAPLDTFTPFVAQKKPPDYGLFFDVDGANHADKFAFDNCRDIPYFLGDEAGPKFDSRFLISQYERLFKFKNSDRYYLVPWMAIPHTIDAGSGSFTFPNGVFKLRVQTQSIYGNSLRLDFPTSKRTLKLKSSYGKILAEWASLQNQTTGGGTLEVNVDAFPADTAVKITIAAGIKATDQNHHDAHIDIEDTGKIVGRLRVLFVARLVQPVFLIKIKFTTAGTTTAFQLERLSSVDVSNHELQSLERSHPGLFVAGNASGFNQIGVEIAVDGDDVDMYDEAHQPIMGPAGGGLRAPYTVLSAGAVPTHQQYQAFVKTFLTRRLAYLRTKGNIANGQPPAKLSKFSRLYFFLTSQTYSATGTNGENFEEFTHIETETKDKVELATSLPGNVSFYRTILAAVDDIADLDARYHEYRTLVHETAHALLVKHFFYDLQKDPSADKDFYKANTWLRLYLGVIDKMPGAATPYATEKIDIAAFKTKDSTDDDAITFFDEIVTKGFDEAAADFIETRVFPGTDPTDWTARAEVIRTRPRSSGELLPSGELAKAGERVPTRQVPLADLIIWWSLNDLVKFKLSQTTNVLDYVAMTRYQHDSQTGKLFTEPAPVRFSRFQWELIRKTVRYYTGLKPL